MMPTQARIFSLAKSLGGISKDSVSSVARSTLNSDQISPTASTAGRPVQEIAMDNTDDKIKTRGITFAGQDSLPKLPIPDLDHTCQKYLAALKPLQNPGEHAETTHAVQQFLKRDGPELQEKLQKYAAGKSSYIEQFWYDSYLNFDNPVVLNLNPFFLLEDDPTPARNNQVTRAASLVFSALEFVRAVRREELSPDSVKGKPLDMYQFQRLFGTARVPTDHGCQIEEDPESTHIVVICHGQFYWFDILDSSSDVIMSERDISINLQTILNDAVETPIPQAAKRALGILSTENRKIWSGLRDVLTREEGSNNADCLGIVDSALFMLCLDYTEPNDASSLCQNMLCGTNQVEKGIQVGTCINRWYDKLQIIVCKNGSAGINFEHTGVDGHTVLRFASDVYTDTILRFAKTINGQSPSLWKTTSPDPSKRDPDSFGDVNMIPCKLEWDMSPELSIAVRFAETRLADLIGQNEFECLDFSGYGKNFITSMGFSPDAFIQMAFQAAYYGLYGRIECTYEPAMTKFFLHGRTEAIRTVSEESVTFVKTFWADNPAEQKVETLRKACQQHVANTRDCAQAKGCDRHLYALYCLWQKAQDERSESRCGADNLDDTDDSRSGALDSSRPRDQSPGPETAESHHMPAIFMDAGWDKLNATVMSTSNCGNPSLRHFGFGPTSGDGFGIGYIIKDDRISVCASSKHRQTRRLVDTLESYLIEIRRILRITSQTSTRRPSALMRAASSKLYMTRAKESSEPPAPGEQTPILNKNKSGGNFGGPPSRAPLKARGRLITGSGAASAIRGSAVMSIDDDEEMGGYGFFDAGMLLQALNARGESFTDLKAVGSEAGKGGSLGVEKSRRRDVGKKLRLVEY